MLNTIELIQMVMIVMLGFYAWGFDAFFGVRS